MHRRTIDIVIVSQTSDLTSMLASVPTPEGYMISFSSTDRLDAIDAPSCDILIHDCATPALDMLRKSFPHAALVFCLDAAQLAQLPSSSRSAPADVWLKPFTAELIRFQLQKLIDHLILERKFSLNQTYLDTLINSVPDLIWFKRLDGIHVKVNDGFCSVVHKDRLDVEGYDHYHIWNIPKEVYENSDYVCLDTDSLVIQSKQAGVFDETVAAEQGMRQLITYKSPILDDRGELVGTVGVAHDVTKLKNTDAKLELILNTMPFAVMITDLAGKVITVNPKFEEYFQVTQEQLIGQPYPICEAFAANAAQPQNLLYYEPDCEIGLLHHRSELILEIHKEPIYDFFANFVGTLHVFRDVTMERGFQARLKKIAYTDQLTGLYTRRYLYENVKPNMSSDNISLLYIDLDNFKLINDSYGHHFGDKILKKTGKLLQTLCPNDICVRMGGDEFLIAIIGQTSIEQLTEKANGIIRSIRDHFPGTALLQSLSVSIGIANMPGGSNVKLDELLRKSDMALYQAKNCGKQQCVVYTLDLENAPKFNP